MAKRGRKAKSTPVSVTGANVDLVRTLALEGAKLRLKALDEERAGLLATFPELRWDDSRRAAASVAAKSRWQKKRAAKPEPVRVVDAAQPALAPLEYAPDHELAVSE